jgi:hypothetical protein
MKNNRDSRFVLVDLSGYRKIGKLMFLQGLCVVGANVSLITLLKNL